MLGFLSKILAGLLVLATLSIVGNFVIGQTILNSGYMKDQLHQANTYSRLSGAISKQVAQNIGIDNPQATAAVQQIITPEALQQRIDPALTQLEGYYKGEGLPPRIEVGDLMAQAQAAGVPIQDTSELSKPIVLSANNNEKPLTNKLSTIGIITIVLAGLLVCVLVFLSWKTKRYAILPNVAIICGVLLGILALLLLFSSGVIDHFVKLDFNSNAYAGIAHDLAKSIAHDLGKRYGIIAGIFLLLGIASRVAVSQLLRRSFSKNVSA